MLNANQYIEYFELSGHLNLLLNDMPRIQIMTQSIVLKT